MADREDLELFSAEPDAQLIAKLTKLAAELLTRNGRHGVTTGDLRYSAENVGLLTGSESLAYMNRLQLGKVIREAGGLSSGEMRRSKVKAAKRSPNVVYVLKEFAPIDQPKAGAA